MCGPGTPKSRVAHLVRAISRVLRLLPHTLKLHNGQRMHSQTSGGPNTDTSFYLVTFSYFNRTPGNNMMYVYNELFELLMRVYLWGFSHCN